jgi:hypothetical protein
MPMAMYLDTLATGRINGPIRYYARSWKSENKQRTEGCGYNLHLNHISPNRRPFGICNINLYGEEVPGSVLKTDLGGEHHATETWKSCHCHLDETGLPPLRSSLIEDDR